MSQQGHRGASSPPISVRAFKSPFLLLPPLPNPAPQRQIHLPAVALADGRPSQEGGARATDLRASPPALHPPLPASLLARFIDISYQLPF